MISLQHTLLLAPERIERLAGLFGRTLVPPTR
jgi:hypothetical protein